MEIRDHGKKKSVSSDIVNDVRAVPRWTVNGGGARRGWEAKERREKIGRKTDRNSSGACLFTVSFYSQTYHKRKPKKVQK